MPLIFFIYLGRNKVILLLGLILYNIKKRTFLDIKPEYD